MPGPNDDYQAELNKRAQARDVGEVYSAQGLGRGYMARINGAEGGPFKTQTEAREWLKFASGKGGNTSDPGPRKK